MPSEAISTDINLHAGESQRAMFEGSRQLTAWNNQNHSDIVGKVELLSKPATTVNLKRSDGTRPMSAYATRFLGMPPIPYGTLISYFSGSLNWRHRNYPLVNIGMPRPGHEPLRTYLGAIPALDRFAADAEARTRTLGKLSQKKWDLGVTALELKQTAGLVTDLAQGMVKTVDNIITAHRRSDKALQRFFQRVIRHGDFSKAAAEVGMTDINLLNDVRARWMQYQFGVKPLIRDVDDSANALATLLNEHGLSVLIRAKSGAERVNDDARIVSRGGAEPYPQYTLHGRSEARVHYSVLYEMPLGNTSFQNNLGLDNPAYLAWEVTRLSWMFDYAVGVGDWLESLTATRNMTFREGCRSELLRFTTNRVVVRSIDSNTPLETVTHPYFSVGGDFARTLIGPGGLTPAVMPVPRSELGLTQLGNALFALSSVAQGKPGLR